MAVNRFRIALNNAEFPLVSTMAQRAVFFPALDNAPRIPRYAHGTDISADYDTARAVFMENVMPIAEGFSSVGYEQLIPPAAPQAVEFDKIFALRDAEENVVLYSPARGKNYLHNKEDNIWESTDFPDIVGDSLDANDSGYPYTSAPVTYAYVDGKTFVCYARQVTMGGDDVSILYWNPDTKALEPAGVLIENLPFPIGQIDGISSSNGYLLVYSDISVAWAPFNGASFDFAEFANGNFTTAGYQTPEDIQGKIRAIGRLAGGFVLFTNKNAVSAQYNANNQVTPWIFSQVQNAGGVETFEQLTLESSLGTIMAYTTTGLQSISLNKAENIHPQVADFLTAKRIEFYNFDTSKIDRYTGTLDFFTKITAIGSRYLVISYGTFPGIYDFALVYDIPLQRWGKLRVQHVDCFYYSYDPRTRPLTYGMAQVPYEFPTLGSYLDTAFLSNPLVSVQNAFGFLNYDGKVTIADWSEYARPEIDQSVLVIGRVQLKRETGVQINRVEVEGLRSGDLIIYPSFDGAELQDPQDLYLVDDNARRRLYGTMLDCINFNIMARGTFTLTTFIVEAISTGQV